MFPSPVLSTITVHWLIDLGVTPFSIIFLSNPGVQLTYPCDSWLSNINTPHTSLSKRLSAFTYTLLDQLVKDEWFMSHWLLSNVGKNVGRAVVRTQYPWVDSPPRYRLTYRVVNPGIVGWSPAPYVEKTQIAWKDCCVEYWYEKVRKHE